MNKIEFRKLAIQRRNAIRRRDEKSHNISERAEALPEFISAKHILAYLDIRSEVKTRQIVQRILDAPQKSCYIPFCVCQSLRIFPLTAWEPLEKKSFGILEPKDEEIQQLDADQRFPIDLALVPGVAFDRELNRIGYGAGYFDRLLSNDIPNANRIALAFDEQIVTSVPKEDFDIPMHRIVTDSETIGPRKH